MADVTPQEHLSLKLSQTIFPDCNVKGFLPSSVTPVSAVILISASFHKSYSDFPVKVQNVVLMEAFNQTLLLSYTKETNGESPEMYESTSSARSGCHIIHGECADVMF